MDQLFFIDTGPGDTNGSPSAETSPLGTGSTTPSAEPGTIPSAKSLKRKLAKERKKEKKLQAGKVAGDTPNDTPNEVEFIGGSALVVEDQAITSPIVTQTDGEAVAPTTSVTDSAGPEVAKQGSGTTVELSLPAHVTVWEEEDPDLSLEDATGALELEEGVEYLDYGDDQVSHPFA